MTIKRDLVKFMYFCRYLGIIPSIASISDRIILQKIFYFLKKFGIPLPYTFNFYKYGPHSSYLTDVYNQLDNYSEFIRDNNYTIKNNEQDYLKLAKEFLEPIKNNADKLEYYASVLFVYSDMFFFESLEDIGPARENKIKDLKFELFERFGLEEPLLVLRNFNLIS